MRDPCPIPTQAPKLVSVVSQSKCRDGGIGLKTRHQCPPSSPWISLRRSQPDTVSITMTMMMISTM